jgi:hypothetical protein
VPSPSLLNFCEYFRGDRRTINNKNIIEEDKRKRIEGREDNRRKRRE